MKFDQLKRREFITLLGGVAAWPLAATAQQAATPVVGFLRSTPSAGFTHLAQALRRGLRDEGFVERQNVAIEERWADNHLDRLPGLAAELLNRGVAVIVCNSISVPAAKSPTATTPIVFVSGDDPVKAGYVSSLNHPEGNLTGITFFGGGQLGAKRMELLRDLVPDAVVVAILADKTYPGFMAELPEIEAAGRALGRRVVVLHAESKAEFGPAFERMVEAGAGALFFAGGPFFTTERRTLAALALHYRLPSISDIRESVAEGVLMSYSASFAGAYRQAGVYVGRTLKGAKPSDLPVLQPSTFELVINTKTAKALGIEIPASIMLRADEVIE